VTAGPGPAKLPGLAGPARPQPGNAQRSPVIVLTHAQSGAALLQHMFADHGSLACTTGTGVLPVCDLAADAWRQVDNREGPLPKLAVTSIRALTDSLITAILAAAGKPRWCEFSIALADTADVFTQLYPAARIICLHRRCTDVIAAGLRAHPWGLSGTPFMSQAAAYPGNGVAAVAAYWVMSTQALLRFQSARPAACYRLRYEDLPADGGTIPDEIAEFLGLETREPGGPRSLPRPGDRRRPSAAFSSPATSDEQVPTDRIPPSLRDQISQLHHQLGYRS
jgi:protein-tyrosine sulfotransferase